MKKLARSFSLLANATFALLILSAALPGQHRMLSPASYGLSEIAPRVWTDAPQRRTELLALVSNAQSNVATFFQSAPPTPTVILCTTQECAASFRIRGNGLSIAYIAVMVAPRGLTIGTLTHEFTHSHLHRSMGLRNIIGPPFPTWFDEGLATHVADHPKSVAPVATRSRALVRTAHRRYQWRRVTRDIGVARAYFAAAAEVEILERRLGRAGLLDLVARVDAGASFSKLLPEN